MFRSFLQLSLRNLFRKNRLFTLINVSGLAIGLACVFLIAIFIYDEYTFDAYHKNADRIHRIVLDFSEEGNTVNWARTSAPIGQYLKGAYPEVEQVVRLRKNPGTDLLSQDEIKFYEERIFFADSSLFDVFDIALSRGDATSALRDKNSIVITDALAKKYFNNDDPIGKSLRLNNTLDLTITGIINEMPANSHFVADAFVTFSSLDELLGEKRLNHWGWMDHYTYVLLAPGSTAEQLQSKFPDFIKKNAPEWVPEKETLFLQSLKSIHMHSDRKDEITPNSRESYSYVLGTIALFILLMACANFINLSTATLTTRFKEISVQKVLGASKFHLSVYFWIESILICAIALFMAFVLAFIVEPYFNLSTGKQISVLGSPWLIAPAFMLTAIIGLLSGIIPTIQTGRLNILNVMKPQHNVMSKSSIRTILITFQFCISIMLIAATWIVSNQFSFLNSSRLGFASKTVMVIPVKDRSQNEKHTTFVNEIKQLPGVIDASYSSSIPAINNAYTYTYTFTGSEAGEQTMAVFLVDENFFSLYKVNLKEGRLPDLQRKDTLADVILNESAITQLQLKDPIGQLVTGQVKGRIVGVVKDFNFATLHSPIQPMIMYAYHQNFRFVSVKLNAGENKAQLMSLDKKWQELYPGFPLEYYFLDDKIEQLYGAESKLTNAYTSFSIVAIVIAGIGLIGLTTYLLNRKLKEISIRKVFGSSTARLVIWIYSGYVKVVLVAALVAWGLGYYWMTKWLNGFAYKTELHSFYFIVPALIMILILLLSTGIQTFKASRTNPINNLKDE
ncbi:MAG TPA: ABC transporter permease [Cyclobacteriaceae bacterium]|nr:ABC transporter permease [Cyclobacteriaceae bacterium]